MGVERIYIQMIINLQIQKPQTPESTYEVNYLDSVIFTE